MKEVSAPWRNKAHKIINNLCRESYLKSNLLPNGKLRKKHVPYAVPEAAEELIKCLNNNDEKRAKSLFLFDYDVNRTA